MTERKREYCRPHYKNEVSIFEKETLQKVEEFRSARSNWVTTYTNQPTNTNTTEGFYESNVYKGRCVCLRRIGFKTTYLRVHHKSLRPLKYYTCRRKLPDSDVVRTESQEKLVSSVEESQSQLKFKKKFFFMRGVDILAKKEIRESSHSCPKIIPENATDYFEEGLIGKEKSKWRRRKIKKDERLNARSGPSKKAIKKLKAARLKSGVVESCKCEDGKELTVVIKGFCFCDKNSLNKLKLDKVRDEYSKMTNITTAPEKKLPPRLINALDVPEKNSTEKFTLKNDDDELKKKKDNLDLPKSDSKKKLTLEEPRDFDRLKDVEELKKVQELNDFEKPRDAEKLKNNEELRGVQKLNDVEKPRDAEQLKNNEELRGVQKLNDVEKPKDTEQLKNNEELKDVQKMNDVEKPKDTEQLKNAKKLKDVEKVKDSQKFEQKPNSEDQSTITLFKNTAQDRSAMALTKEQFEKMKENATEKKNTKI